MRKLSILILGFFLTNCANNSTDPAQVVISSMVEFSITNQNGDDLLNPSTEGYYPLEAMQLYYVVGGEKVKVQDFDPQVGGTNGLMLITETTPYRLRCFTNSYGQEGIISTENDIKTGDATAYLEYNAQETDTIVTEWEKKDNKYFINKKVWYNGELHEPAELPFQIVK